MMLIPVTQVWSFSPPPDEPHALLNRSDSPSSFLDGLSADDTDGDMNMADPSESNRDANDLDRSLSVPPDAASEMSMPSGK